MPSETLCPFCDRREMFIDNWDFFRLTEYGQFDFYRCPCGAVALPSDSDFWSAGWHLDAVEEALCTMGLGTERGDCRVELNPITGTDPPRLMLWAKARTGTPA